MVVSIFFIVLLAAFAVLVFFTEPSRTDKLISARLVSLDQRLNANPEEDLAITREITFSTIPAIDRFLRTNPCANKLLMLIQQADSSWTVGRFISLSLLCMI